MKFSALLKHTLAIENHVYIWQGPVKYKRDSKNLIGTFVRSIILLAEKLTNEALVTPAQEGYCVELEPSFNNCILSNTAAVALPCRNKNAED